MKNTVVGLIFIRIMETAIIYVILLMIARVCVWKLSSEHQHREMNNFVF